MPLPTEPLPLAIAVGREWGFAASAAPGLVITQLADGARFDEVVDALDQAHMLEAPHPASHRIEWKLPAGYFQTLDDLLAVPSCRRVIPRAFFVADQGTLYEGIASETDLRNKQTAGDAPPVLAYLQAARLLAALEACADHTQTIGHQVRLIFLHKRKSVISDAYESGDLRLLDGVDAFISDYLAQDENQKHWDQKQVILRVALEELFEPDTPIPFGAILRRYAELKNSVRAGYMLYVSEFSFAKFKEDVEKDKIEFIAKLNKVFADIQSQLLAIPAALILIGSQMEHLGRWGTKNLLIVLGAFAFAILMDLLIRNQHHTLAALGSEIKREWGLIEGRHAAVASEFRESYDTLIRRERHQRLLLGTVSALVAGSLSISVIQLLRYSVPKLLIVPSLMSGLIAGLAIVTCHWACKRARRGEVP